MPKGRVRPDKLRGIEHFHLDRWGTPLDPSEWAFFGDSSTAALGFLGLLDLREGQPRRAVETLNQGVTLARRLAGPNVLGPNLGFLGQALTEAGDLEAARAVLDEAVTVLATGGRPYAMAWVWVARTAMECAAGDIDAARRALAETERVGAIVAVGAKSDIGVRVTALRAWLLGR